MRYIYFPKLLKDLENMEQYSELLPYGVRVVNMPSDRVRNLGFCNMDFNMHYTSVYTRLLSSVHGKYMRYCIAPVHYDISEYAEANNTIFYAHSPSQALFLTQQILLFAIRSIERCLVCPLRNIQSHEIGEAILVLLKQLIKDYESEDAFRKDVLKNYHFELTDGLFAFTGINSNLDDLDGLVKSIYAPVKNIKNWDTCWFYCNKLSGVINEIDFLADSADYDQLCAYEYLLHDDCTRDNKQFSEVRNNPMIVRLLKRRDEVRKHVVKAKQLVSQGRKMSLQLDDLSVEDVKPKNIKLRLQW